MDDNPVIVKTIVMLEREKPSLPVVQSSDENMVIQKEHYGSHDKVEKNDMISDYATIHAPALPMEGLVIEAVQSQIQEQPKFHMVGLVKSEHFFILFFNGPHILKLMRFVYITLAK